MSQADFVNIEAYVRYLEVQLEYAKMKEEMEKFREAQFNVKREEGGQGDHDAVFEEGPVERDEDRAGGQRTRSGSELRRNGRFYVRPKSGFWPKNGSYPKKSPKMTFSPLIIWAKALFFFEQLFSVVARTWLEYKSVCLFAGLKISHKTMISKIFLTVSKASFKHNSVHSQSCGSRYSNISLVVTTSFAMAL